jgi:hypothetical protein
MFQVQEVVDDSGKVSAEQTPTLLSDLQDLHSCTVGGIFPTPQPTKKNTG